MTTTTFTPDAMIQPFTTFPETFVERSRTPRAEVVFSIFDEDVTAGGAGSQFVSIVCSPPVNFAYALVDCYLSIDAADATELGHWSNNAVCNLTQGNDNTGVAQEKCRVPGRSNGPQMDPKFQKGYNFDPLPGRLWRPTDRSAALFQLCSVMVANDTIGDAAAQAGCYVRFLQYDVSQAHHSGVNTSVLVR